MMPVSLTSSGVPAAFESTPSHSSASLFHHVCIEVKATDLWWKSGCGLVPSPAFVLSDRDRTLRSAVANRAGHLENPALERVLREERVVERPVGTPRAHDPGVREIVVGRQIDRLVGPQTPATSHDVLPGGGRRRLGQACIAPRATP